MIQAIIGGSTVDFAAIAVNAATAVHDVTRMSGLELLTIVQDNASGAPGPEIQTGRYRSSISLEYDSSSYISSATVYSDEPYGAELEYGGHHGHAAHPHFGPAAEEIEFRYISELEREVRRL